MTPPDRLPPDADRTVPSEGDHTVPTDSRTVSSAGGSADVSTPLPESVGHYSILGKLGEGSMGVVYEAEQQSPKRRVALKVVRGG